MLKKSQQQFFHKIIFFVLLASGGCFVSGSGKNLAAADGVNITEIMYNPAGADPKHEWLEVYNNSGEAKDLTGWKLFEANVNHGLFLLQGDYILPAGEYALIADDAVTFQVDHPAVKGTLFDSVFSLSNAGEAIALKDNSGNVVANFAYTNNSGGDGNGFSLEQGADGEWRESYVADGTPGAANSQKPAPKTYPTQVHISEVLPNAKEEFIELFNPAAEPADLVGWILRDASKTGKYVFPADTEIAASNFLVVYKKDFKFALNNSGAESVSLYNPAEILVDQVAYTSSKANVSYNFTGSAWRWSRFVTPGAANKFNNPAETESEIEKEIYAGVYADFAVRTSDADGDAVKVTWDFGDGHKSYKAVTRHKYGKAGKYTVRLKITDGSEEETKEYAVAVEDYPHPKVKIVRFCPNPAGTDSDGEWLEIENKSKKKINLNGWSVATGWKKLSNHPIAGDIVIKAGKTVKLTRAESKFTLGNEKTKIELRYPDGEVSATAKFKYKKSAAEDEVFAKEKGGGWKGAVLQGAAKTKIARNNTVSDGVVLGENSVADVPAVMADEIVSIIGQQSRLRVVENQILLALRQADKFGLNLEAEIKKERPVIEAKSGYVFTENPGYRPPDHYALRFAKNILQKTNQLVAAFLR